MSKNDMKPVAHTYYTLFTEFFRCFAFCCAAFLLLLLRFCEWLKDFYFTSVLFYYLVSEWKILVEANAEDVN